MNILERLSTHRKALHPIPELGFECIKTSAYIEAQLQALGYTTQRYAKTGVVAHKQGKSNRCIAFRSDMDGLPIHEESDYAYPSLHPCTMHACGHDGHMSTLLSFAELIKEEETDLSVLFIFQPAEEGPGGAQVMIEEGLFEDYPCEAIFGLHLDPSLEMGKIGFVKGEMMASSVELKIHIQGQSAHAASPQEGIDAIFVASQAISAYQSIVSRSLDPKETCVLSLGTIEGGEAQNVIAKSVSMKGTIRAYQDPIFDLALSRLHQIHQGLEAMYGVKIQMEAIRTYPAVINDAKLFRLIYSNFEASKSKRIPKMMFAEDFSDYQKVIPGLFVMLGIKDEYAVFPLHHAKFNFREEALLTGVDYYRSVLDIYSKLSD